MQGKKQRPEPARPPQERKSPPLGNNLVWYLLALGIGTLFLVFLMSQESQVEIPYGQLVELIKQKSPDKNREAAIEIWEGKGKEKRVRYSNLTDLTVGPHEITGKVNRQIMAPEQKEAEFDVQFHTARMGLDNANNDLAKKLEENGFTYVRGENPPSGWRVYAQWFLLLGASMLLIVFMFRRMGGAGSAMAFGRSRGKLYAQEEVGLTFDDVAGLDEAVGQVRQIVDFLKTPEKYQVLGGRIPKGVLLVGPPGTGKTLLAKAIAGEASVPFFSLSGSDFVEMFVGVGAARVRDMFQQAQAKSPCIVFIDELDALGKVRGTSNVGGDHEREQTLNALLVEMDGFGTNSGVIVLAATNRPETLDPALLRPGRFDRHVLVDRPDVRGREEILEVHVQKVRLDKSVNLKEVAKITPGFVGADLANLVNEAALLAAQEGKSSVTMHEFNEGVERVVAGLEKRQRIMHPDEKQRVAYHESAHALVACSLPNADPVHKVSIIPRGLAALGYTMQRPEGDRFLMTQSELNDEIQVLLAGSVAEEIIFDDVSSGAQNDLERATEIARRMVMDFGMSRLGRVTYRESRRTGFLLGPGDMPRERTHSEETAREIDEEIKHIVNQGLERVRHILETRRPALVAIAERLIEQETIENGELKQLIEANSPGPMIVPGTEDTAKRRPAEEPAADAPPELRAEGAS
jgi:cell division protease FtsH